jgi:hypothetical protein
MPILTTQKLAPLAALPNLLPLQLREAILVLGQKRGLMLVLRGHVFPFGVTANQVLLDLLVLYAR